MFYVYLLKSEKHDELYIGSTNDLKKCLVEHNKSKVVSTKSKCPYKLIYYESYVSELDARKRESMLKLRGQARVHLLSRLINTLKQNEN